MASDDFIHALPKVELHLHIEGTLEPEMRFELAARNGIELPFKSAAEVRESYGFTDLTSFLVSYYEAMNVLQTPQDFHDLAFAYLKKAASQNVRHVEIFFDPQAHTCRGVPFDNVMKGLISAQQQAEREFGIHSGLVLCFLRDFSAEHAMSTLLESLPYKPWIVGVGLDSDERDNPPNKFEKVFARARQEGYLITMHCDVDQKNTLDHIDQALNQLEVSTRIDHGTNIIEDDALVEQLLAKDIGLTCCPISNTWVSDGSKVDLMTKLLDRGVKITINSDDPAYFGGYVEENYRLAAKEGGWDEARLAQVARNAVDISWAPLSVKERIRAEIDQLVN